MVMALSVVESGRVVPLKRPGAVLNAGDVIARLDLDDPSRVVKAKLFEGELPPSKTSMPRGDQKLNQIYITARTTLDNILNGRCNGRGMVLLFKLEEFLSFTSFSTCFGHHLVHRFLCKIATSKIPKEPR